MGTVLRYFSSVRLELSKVIWPKRNEVIRFTLIVIAISAIVAIYLGGIDFLLTKLLTGAIIR